MSEPMKLSRLIPTHRRTEKFLWCKPDFMLMSAKFRAVRARSSNPMNACYWCGHKFDDGEMMALSAPEKGRNRVLCQVCVRQMEPTFLEGK